MLLTVTSLLVLAAFVFTLGSITNPPKTPLWVAVLLLCIVHLLSLIPLK